MGTQFHVKKEQKVKKQQMQLILNNREMYTVNQGAIIEILYDEVPEAISKGEADKNRKI